MINVEIEHLDCSKESNELQYLKRNYQEVLTYNRGGNVCETERWYKFSNYVIDPNKFRLDKVVTILALVMLFIRNLKQRVGYLNVSPPGRIGTAVDKLFHNNELFRQRYIVTEGNT